MFIRVISVTLLISVSHAHAQTQAAMNAQTRADFARADADLNKTYQAVLAKLTDASAKQKLRETQRAWVASRDAEAARAAKEAEGGSMASTLRYEKMTDLTRQRIQELKTMLGNGTVSPTKPAAASVTPSPSSTPEPVRQQAQSVSEAVPDVTMTSGPVSPDKKWEYVGGETPRLVKAGTNEVALNFLDDCGSGGVDEHSAPLWAPDSKRLAFYSCGAGKEHFTLLYQLRDDHWVTLKAPNDDNQISERPSNIIDAKAKREGLPKGTFLHMQWWKIEPRQWLDATTLILYASLAEVVHGRNGEDVGPGYSADLLFTLKFDDAGNWKVVQTHEMTGKAAQSPSRSSPLSDDVAYRSPLGSYRIQASVDGKALWIVSTKDPGQRKPLPGADPDNRLPEEFSCSPDDTWLFDNRQHELYRNTGDLAFSVFKQKQWLRKNALDYASREFRFPRKDIECDSAGWSFDSARMLIHFEASLHHRFAYFNTRTRAFEQTPYLRMVNTKLRAEKSYEAFPNAQFATARVARYMVFAESIEAPPSEAILKPRFDTLDQEMNTLREKVLADLATRPNSDVEFSRSQNDNWNKGRDEAVQLYVPFAPKDQEANRKLQFLCDLTQEEVNGLKEELK